MKQLAEILAQKIHCLIDMFNRVAFIDLAEIAVCCS